MKKYTTSNLQDSAVHDVNPQDRFDNNTITAHGFSAVASTFLNTLSYRSKVIEAELAHKDKNQIKRACNHVDTSKREP